MAKTTGTRRDKRLQKAFGLRLRAIRKRREMTQEGLATKAKLTRFYIILLEKGASNPTLLIVNDLARALRVPVKDLTDGSSD